MFLTSSCNLAICLFERYFSILFKCRAGPTEAVFNSFLMTEDALTVFWSTLVRSTHFSALDGATLWLLLRVWCVLCLWVVVCFCLWDLSNCHAIVPGLGYFLPGMMLLFVNVAHVLY